MPVFLENKLKAEYPNDPAAPFKIMNTIGAMHGNQITAKGREMDDKHQRDMQQHMTRQHILRGLSGK